MRILWAATAAPLLLLGTLCAASQVVLNTVVGKQPPADGGPITKIHKAGYCAIRGQCGKKSIFGPQLPCPDNGPAQELEEKVRQKLVEICGDEWRDGPVCCEESQLDDLASNLKRAGSIISSCPACKANFFNLFCSFTCSPNQSLFVNVTNTEVLKSGKTIVAELDYFVSEEYGSGFYDSCKDVKFSATNGYVMDFIGGGAKNYTAFLKFLGDKKPFGSPFQMNFPREMPEEIEEFDPRPKKCNDEDEAYRCACVDCPSVCAALPEVEELETCMVNGIPCVSITVMIMYAVFLTIVVLVHIGKVVYDRKENKKGGRPLLHDPRPSDDEDEGSTVDGGFDKPTKEYRLNTILDDVFSKIGRACATYPGITIAASVVVVALMSIGWKDFAVETDPVRLWVAPTSAAAQEKAFFDDNFGPFYRANQAFLVNDTEGGEVLNYDNLDWWFDVETRIRRLKSPEQGLVLEDVCFKPTGEGCVVQSITGWFGGDFDMVDPTTWKENLRSCAAQPVQQQCLPDFGQPLKSELLLGGWQESGDVAESKAIIVTWVVNNHPEGSDELASAMDWEQGLKGTLLAVQAEAKERGLRLSFSTEISLEQELNKSTNTDAKIVVVSYIAMFFYASLALGSTSLALRTLINSPIKAFVESKFTLGVFGIVIVLMSVSASVGLFSAMGIKVTLIIAEVIPFLVLAVGVDNIFLIVHEFERVNYRYPESDIPVRVGKTLGRIGPSILLSATTETIAFALGAVVDMPAVRNFAIYAAGAVFINAILQVTMFVAVLAMNEKRVKDGRLDCLPCVKVPGFQDCNGCVGDLRVGIGRGPRNGYAAEEEGFLDSFIRKKYAPWLMKTRTKVITLTIFLGFFAAGIALLPDIELGLDQRIAIPSDSYLIEYFNDLYEYLGTGPPVYFVTREFNATQVEHQKSLCGRFGSCDSLSVANMLELERKRPEISYISEPAASWIDDYLLWLNPELDTCCRINPRTGRLCKGGLRCEVCFENREPSWNITLAGMPEGGEFIKYLSLWLTAPTNEDCPLAGRAGYANALVYDKDTVTVTASHFRTSHTKLASQMDFINAYASARRIAEEMSQRTGAHIFPYSKFYIFFDQYATIANLTTTLLLSALGAILVLSSLLLGSIRTGLTIAIAVTMIVVDIMGIMALWHVSLNAVSLVNLVICVGIAVEFCSHIARAYMFPPPRSLKDARNKYKLRGRDARAWAALVNVGGSVFSGITITKLIGVTVLAWTRSRIFEVYYFRMWVALVGVAGTHALVVLPIMLSVIGGREGYVAGGDGEGVEDDLRGRGAYREVWGVDGDEDDDDETSEEEDDEEEEQEARGLTVARRS